MDCNKTSSFIAKMRKQKGWTQNQLAHKLGITDKAISRWETGKGYPDISLLKPLGEALNVSVNEILAGEIIEQEHLQEKTDNMLVKALTTTKEKVHKAITCCLYIFGGIVFLWSFVFLGYDTSWVSFYSTFGLIIIGVALFITFRKRLVAAISAVLILLLLFIGFTEARDYTYIKEHNMPPLFNLSIITTFFDEKVIKYDKLFYDVYRYNVDTEDEYYEIKPNNSDVTAS